MKKTKTMIKDLLVHQKTINLKELERLELEIQKVKKVDKVFKEILKDLKRKSWTTFEKKYNKNMKVDIEEIEHQLFKVDWTLNLSGLK